MLSYRNSYSHIHFKLIVLKKSGEIFLVLPVSRVGAEKTLEKATLKVKPKFPAYLPQPPDTQIYLSTARWLRQAEQSTGIAGSRGN